MRLAVQSIQNKEDNLLDLAVLCMHRWDVGMCLDFGAVTIKGTIMGLSDI